VQGGRGLPPQPRAGNLRAWPDRSFVLRSSPGGYDYFALAAPAKNVIFLLTDGTGPEAWPIARWVKGSALNVDSILTGAILTYGADSIITDSAPGATAYATGYKGTDKFISVGAWAITVPGTNADPALKYVPLATVLEGARLSGRAPGVVATSNVQHATPAAFSSHNYDRNNYNDLGEQQVYQGIDVVLSGGSQYFLPKDQGGKREDGENLVEIIKSKGYVYVTNKDELAAVKAGKVWGAFVPDAMAYDIDRAEFAPSEPAIKDMTAKAIELLASSAKGKTKGFFLFVEGSKTDWAAHADDPAGVKSELLAFDEAVGAALDFAKKDKNTLVVVVADHGTGGISIGTASDSKYSQTQLDSLVLPLRAAKITAESLDKLVQADASPDAIKAVVADKWAISDLSADEVKAIADLAAAKKSTSPALVAALSKRARVGWTTGGHTGADVFLFAYGPGRPTGLVENVEIGADMASAMGFDFASLNKRLFVDAIEALKAAGIEAAVDKSDAANPVLVVKKGDKTVSLPCSKNLVLVGSKTTELEGLVLYVDKLDKAFAPAQAVNVVKAALK
jgi:alkaline phosphatase